MSGVQNRVEKLTEKLRPEPAELLTVVVTRFTPIAEAVVLGDEHHRVGRYGVATFLGGTPKERAAMLRKLRMSGAYDADPCARAVEGGAAGACQLPSGDDA